MAGIKVAKRYARSFLGLTAERGQLEAAYNDMSLLVETISENRDLMVMLKSPVINTDKKISILTFIYAKHISKASLLFITLITRKRREGLLEEIAKEFIVQYKVNKGITTATVTSATALSADAEKRILEIVQNQVGGTVDLQTVIDPELIGGFVLLIGDKQLDTSISSRLDELRQELVTNHYQKGL